MATQTMRQTLGQAEAEVLAALLTDEIAAQKELLSSLKEKEKFLVKQSLGELETWIANSQAVLTRVEAIGKRRQKTLAQFVRPFLPRAEARYSHLAARAEPTQRTRLESLIAELEDAVKKTARQNQKNALLARESMTLNQAILRTIFDCPSGHLTYVADGYRTNSLRGDIVDREA